jgi:hypothetical protein
MFYMGKKPMIILFFLIALFVCMNNILTKGQGAIVPDSFDISFRLETLVHGLVGIVSSGEGLLIGEFADLPEEYILLKEEHKDKSNIIVSLDYLSGNVFVGFFDDNRLKGGDYRTPMKLRKSGKYYDNAKGDPYSGGATILQYVCALSSQDSYILWEAPEKKD